MKIFELSLLKTLRFNLRYFGLRGLKMPVLVSRNYVLSKMEGKCDLHEFRTGIVRLGFSGVGIFDKHYDRGIWECMGSIHFKGNASLGLGTKISVASSGELSIGRNFRVTAKSEIICCKQIDIGDDVLISWDSILMDTDFHQINDGPRSRSVVIGDSVWIGMRSMVLKGAIIPRGSVVAAGATITDSLCSPNCLYGNVNYKIKDNITWSI